MGWRAKRLLVPGGLDNVGKEVALSVPQVLFAANPALWTRTAIEQDLDAVRKRSDRSD